jgi:hypothetical protein
VSISTAGALTIESTADSKVNVEAKQSILGPNKPATAFDTTIGIGIATIESTAWVQSGAKLDVGGDLLISAKQIKSHDVTSSAGAYEDGAVGTAFALSGAASAVNALLDADADVTGSVAIVANTEVVRNDTAASAQVGTGVIGGGLLAIKNAVGLGNATGSFFQQISPQPDERGQKPTKFALSAAVAWADHDNRSLARIDAGAEVSSSTGNVEVSSSIQDILEISARAFVDSQAGQEQPAGNTKKNSVSAAVVVGNFEIIRRAHRRGAVVDARQESRSSRRPRSAGDGLVSIREHRPGRSRPADTDHANSNFGQNGIFTRGRRATRREPRPRGVFGRCINIATRATPTSARTRDQSGSALRSGDRVRVEATSLVEGASRRRHGLKLFGASGGQNGVGGSYLEVDYETAVTAQIQGRQLYADALIVRADSKTITSIASRRQCQDLSINGAFSVRENNRTLARTTTARSSRGGDAASRFREWYATASRREQSGCCRCWALTLSRYVARARQRWQPCAQCRRRRYCRGAAGRDRRHRRRCLLTNLNSWWWPRTSPLCSTSPVGSPGTEHGVGFSVAIKRSAAIPRRWSATARPDSKCPAWTTRTLVRPPARLRDGEEVQYDPGTGTAIVAAACTTHRRGSAHDPLAQSRADALPRPR